jgi:hypothetical protein
LAEAAHEVSAAIIDGFRRKSTFDGRFPDLRCNSRLGLAHIYLSGIGELTASLLARLVGCSEPGARKMLKQLVEAGFGTHHPPAPVFERVENFRLGWPGAAWLRTFSSADVASIADQFDD